VLKQWIILCVQGSLEMGTPDSSAMLINIYKIMQCHNLEDNNPDFHSRENHKV
jgi:hypothetical protein